MKRVLALLGAVSVAFALVACSGNDTEGTAETSGDPWDAQAVDESMQDAALRPVVVNSNLGVGQNRVALALIDPETGAPVGGPDVAVTFFWLGESLDDRSGLMEVGRFEFVPRSLDLSLEAPHDEGMTGHDMGDADSGDLVTMYTAVVDLDRSGWWGAAVDMTSEQSDDRGVRLTFAVQDRTSEPMVGEAAPRSEQPVLTDGGDPTAFTTADPVTADFLDTTIAEAIDSGKPVVVAFVTPAFCVTRFCGPVLQAAVEPVYQELQGQVEFIQVEPYDLVKARAGEGLVPVPVVEEWKLEAEPFVFVLAPGGTVAAKFEGVMDAQELRDAVVALVN